MSYLNKKKMYEMLKSIVDTKLEMMKDASYRFYRGSEWLELKTNDNIYKLYHQGNSVSLNISTYDEKGTHIEMDRIVFRFINGKLVQVYKRSDYKNY